MKVTKVVISTERLGTRVLPATKTQPKSRQVLTIVYHRRAC